MRAAGLVVARTLERLVAAVRPGVTTGELDRVAEESIRGEGAVPSFLGYYGFPGTICASVGSEVVHGIPDPGREVPEGVLLSLDCGAVLAGWHGDAAVTVPVGECAPELVALSAVTERALWEGLAAVRPGGRLSDVGAAVQAAVRPHGYGLLEDYTGHGIGTAMHEPPAVPNLAPRGPGHGMDLVPGIVLAVEPMVTLGSAEVAELDDGWTVVTLDGRQAAHWEHTVAVTPEGPWVLTALDGGVGPLGTARPVRTPARQVGRPIAPRRTLSCRTVRGAVLGCLQVRSRSQHRRQGAHEDRGGHVRQQTPVQHPTATERGGHAEEGRGHRDRGPCGRAAPERHVPGGAAERPPGPGSHQRQDAAALHPHPP